MSVQVAATSPEVNQREYIAQKVWVESYGIFLVHVGNYLPTMGISQTRRCKQPHLCQSLMSGSGFHPNEGKII